MQSGGRGAFVQTPPLGYNQGEPPHMAAPTLEATLTVA